MLHGILQGLCFVCRLHPFHLNNNHEHEHRGSINHRDSDHSTTLSSHIWDLKDANKNFEVSWEILGRAQPFNPVNKKCNLCIKEKYFIIFQPQGSSLNQRNELFSTCRHRKKELLENFLMLNKFFPLSIENVVMFNVIVL